MKWNETIASKCRYGDNAGTIFGNAEIIWENSESDYQGSANILAQMPDGRFAHYAWTYGSCSGCDAWEAAGLTDEQIEEEMTKTTAWLPDVDHLKRYLHLEGEYQDARLPIATEQTNGSIPGMMKYIFGGWGTDFEEMRKAAIDWLNKQQTSQNNIGSKNPTIKAARQRRKRI